MTWLFIDDRTDENPRVAQLSDAAYRLWSYSLVYCARELTDGHIVLRHVKRLAEGRRIKPLIRELTQDFPGIPGWGPLWEVDEERGGYRVVHFSRWNRTREEILKRQEAARIRKEQWRARRAARGGPVGEPDVDADDDFFFGDFDDDLPPPPPRHPRPSGPRPAPREEPSVTEPRRAAARNNVNGRVASAAGRGDPSVAPKRDRERVPNAAPLPLHDQEIPTPVCDLDPRVPAPASTAPEEHAHTAPTVEGSEHEGTEGAASEVVPRPDAAAPAAPRTNAAPERESGHEAPNAPSPPPDPGTDPDAVAIEAHLRAMPEPMCHLATPEHASRFAGARMAGLTLAEIRTAISTAGLKLGRHRGAHPSKPNSLDALADHVGSFIANQRRVTSRVVPTPREADPVDVERFVHKWCDAYQAATSVAYTVTDEDRGYAAEVLELAHQAALQEGVRTGREEAGLEDRIAEHWLRAYLDDEGPAGYLAKARHPLRYLKRQVGTYGLPRAPTLAKCPIPEEPEEVTPTDEERAAGAAQVLRAVVAGIGGGGGSFVPPAVRGKPRDPETS
jgi:hypothetical protein